MDKQQIIQLVQAAMQGDQQATQQIQQIMQAAQQIQQIMQATQQGDQQMQQQQMRTARFGVKLNYIKQLKGQCPEGYQIEYYQYGGQFCKRCRKKEQGGNISNNIPTTVSEQFKMEAAKCGKKMKKKENGGAVEAEKCGGKPKLKKKAYGGPVKEKKISSAKVGTNTKKMVKLNPKKSWSGSVDGSGSEDYRAWQDGTHSYRQRGVDTPNGKADYYEGRRGEKGNTKGTLRERQIADSLRRVDWTKGEVPSINKRK